MATDKTPNYTAAQETLILAEIAKTGANLQTAERLAAMSDMYDAEGKERKPRAITAKMSRMAEKHGFKYERKQPTTKDGKPVTNKTDLVAKIAAALDVATDALDGLEKSPKAALETLHAVIGDMIADRDAEREESEAA